MGLDQYLYARRYTSNYKHAGKEDNDLYKALLTAAGIKPREPEDGAPSCTLSVTCAYWRKVNAIHAWFVNKVQGGVDECEEHCVTREQLQELRDLCAKAIAEKDGTLLEPMPGFFFGSTDIDECYWKDLENTIEQWTAS